MSPFLTRKIPANFIDTSDILEATTCFLLILILLFTLNPR